MIRRAVDTVIGAVCLGCVGYVYFFVPVGQRTLFEHTRRIAATEPAQELQRDATSTAHTLGARVVDELERMAPDGGVAAAPSQPTSGESRVGKHDGTSR
jgi:hypothetical protein